MYLEKLRENFDELRQLFLKKNEEIELVRVRMEKSITQVKNESLTKFSKDLLDVVDEFIKLDTLIKKSEISTSPNKDENFHNLLEGNL